MKKLTPEAINPNHLYDDPRYFTKEGNKVYTHDNVQPVGLFDPVTRTIPSAMSGQGLNVKKRDMRNAGALGAGAAGVAIIVPAAPDEIWEVTDIYASFLCNAFVIARTASLQIFTGRANTVRTVIAVGNSYVGTDVNLIANQTGAIWMTGGNFNYIDTNGVIAATATDENIFPLYLGPGSIIRALYTANGQALDATGIDIYYRLIGQMD